MTERSRISALSHSAHTRAIMSQVTIPVSQNNVWIMDASMPALPVSVGLAQLLAEKLNGHQHRNDGGTDHGGSPNLLTG
jgi:hypothetical protein